MNYWSRAYIASPFFNPEQIRQVEQIEKACEDYQIEGLSPRKFLVLKPRSSILERRSVFQDNIDKIQTADVILANIDGYDAGTLWEMGYAYALSIPVIGISLTGKNMNVMLACGCRGFVDSLNLLREFLIGIAPGYEDINNGRKTWDFNWGVTEQWLKSIY